MENKYSVDPAEFVSTVYLAYFIIKQREKMMKLMLLQNTDKQRSLRKLMLKLIGVEKNERSKMVTMVEYSSELTKIDKLMEVWKKYE